MRARPLVLAVLSFLVVLLVLASSSPRALAAESYDPSVFSPNGTAYRFYAHILYRNETGDCRERMESTLEGDVTIFSRRYNNTFFAWSLGVHIKGSMFQNSTGEEPRELSIEVPGIPLTSILAVREGTRETYLMFDLEKLSSLASGQAGGASAQDLLREALKSTGHVYGEIYFTNFFYIPVNVGISHEIEYGVHNKTSGESYSVFLKICLLYTSPSPRDRG